MDKMNLALLAEKFVVIKQKFHKMENVRYHGNPLFLYRRATSAVQVAPAAVRGVHLSLSNH